MTSFRCELPPDVVTDWIKAFGFKNLRDRRSLLFPAANPVYQELFEKVLTFYYPSRKPTIYDYNTCKKILRQILKKSGYLLLSKEVRINHVRTHEYMLQPLNEVSETFPLADL
jgi:hypothetical protein